MGGICGQIYFDTKKQIDENQIKKMSHRLAHNCLNIESIFVQQNIGFCHCDLKTFNEAENHKEVMTNKSKNIILSYHGEIYNTSALKQELEDLGYCFYKNTDDEVVLYAYEQFGVNCLEKFRGTFVLALYDYRDQSLFLAVDRVGEKPLFYCFTDQGIVFASELPCLLENVIIPLEINPEALHYYLHYHYVPTPLTIYKNIQKLPAAHYLLCKNNQVALKRYWRLSYVPKHTNSLETLQEEMEEILKESIQLRLQSHYPLGAFLSGGIDSSTIVALCSEMTSESISTFSIGFDNIEYNELPYARQVAEFFHTKHTEYIVQPDIETLLPKLIQLYGEPYADSSLIPSYYLCQVAKQHIAIALTGDGGDESLAGYHRYGLHVYAHRIPQFLLQCCNIFPFDKFHTSNTKGLLHKMKRLVQNLNKPPIQRYLYWISHLPSSGITEIYTPEFFKEVQTKQVDLFLQEAYNNAIATHPLDKIISTDIDTYLLNDLLPKTYIASMEHSLRTRSPLLDHTWLEFTAKLPPSYKYKLLQGKRPLRTLLAKKLPESFFQRPKQGFAIPLGNWLRTTLQQFTYDTLLSQEAQQRGFFQPQKIQKILEEHNNNIVPREYQIYNLLMLELFFQQNKW
ncbi:MAG TPA: asparagine synthase (glutamine-hydrolyzing) [Planctomycetota bacterium]|nr:asparagine synthase (glutamine-hydrolyzing) [Planctomycetota bacterium]HQB01028.1 asparagine synthase (glutamine-hydrolyzing) [Planctomycetota bacterium]